MPIHILPTAETQRTPVPHEVNARGYISRRKFLAGAAAAGVASLVEPSRLLAGEERPTVWAFVSDTHISHDPPEKVRGHNMADNLKRVVEEVLAAKPDRVLFNGDMAYKKGRPEDYEAFLKIIAPIRERNTPLHFTIGNHDHRGNFITSIEDGGPSPVESKWVTSLVDSGTHWVFLDSLHKLNRPSGRLGPQQLEWLGQLLDGQRDRTTIICLHHNPEESVVGLKDTEAFLNVVRPRRQVKAVLFGHTHAYREWTDDGLHFINLPATGYFFNPLKSLGWVKAKIGSQGMDLDFVPLKKRRAKSKLTWRTPG